MFPTASVVALALLLVSCGGKADEKAGGGGGDGSAATDDSAASSDGTAEDPRTLDTGGSDSDSGDSPADICENPASVTPVDECVDHVLTCNRTMLHTTRAGARRFSGEDYAAWGCGEDLPTDRYRARERIYSPPSCSSKACLTNCHRPSCLASLLACAPPSTNGSRCAAPNKTAGLGGL